MIKIFTTHPAVFTGKSSDYITKEAVERANKRLMGLSGGYTPALEDVYEKHQLTRPTKEQIIDAAKQAMRQVVALE